MIESWATRRAKRHRGGEVINNLRHDTRPIDGIHTREARPIAECMVIEHTLHHRLTVVECALDRQRMTLREKLRWLRSALAVNLGFGGAICACLLVPVVGLLLAPAFVVGGTLLWMDYGERP